MRQQAESVGIPFKVGKVFPFGGREERFQGKSLAFGKLGTDSFFSRMAKRWIAQVVCKAGSRYDGTDFGQMRIVQFWVLLQEDCGYFIS